MLEEAQALRAAGVDVVIGYFEPHGRKDTIARTEGLEVVPRRVIAHGGAQFEEMDTDAIIRRRPRVAVVDELAHTNVPGSEREKRWQDALAIRDAGIDVHSTLNVQHLESLNDQIWRVTGVRVRETVPDWVMDEADEVVFVDLTPGALRNRLERGVIYAPDKAQRAMEKFFTPPNLTALREIAMRLAAHEVEGKMRAEPRPAGSSERILICLTGSASAAILIRRGKRVADYLQAECLALHVASPGEPGAQAVDRHMRFARSLRIETNTVESRDVADAIADFARSRNVTQIFLGRAQPRPIWRRFSESVVQQVVRQARDKQITIVAQRG